MKLFNIFIIGIASCIALACSKSNIVSDAPEFYDLTSYEKGTIYDIFDSVEVVPLLFEQDTYPDMICDVECADGKVFIQDTKTYLHVFSANTGHYISCSRSKYGNGPGEYMAMTGFIINPFTKKMEVLTYTRMYSFDDSFECSRTIDIPGFIGNNGGMAYDNGYALSDSKYIITASNIAMDPYTLVLYDASNEEVLASWNYYDDVICPVHMWTRCFYTMPDGEILYTPGVFTHYIYSIDDDRKGMHRKMEFHYDTDVMSDTTVKVIRGNQEIIDEYYKTTSVAFPMRQLVNSYMVMTMIKKGRVNTMYTIVSDRKTGKNMRIDHFDFGEQKYKMPLIKHIDEDYCYFVEDKNFILDSPDILMDKAGQAEELLSGIDDEDFVLLKYRIKKPA